MKDINTKTLKIMKFYKYILAITLLLTSCEVDNIGTLIDDNIDKLVFFNNDGLSIGEQVTENIVVEVRAVLKSPLSTQVTLGGTAVEGVDYRIIGDLDLDFSTGSSIDNIVISLIDNENFNDDHTIVLSLPTGFGYSENNRREFTINVVNNELNSGTVIASINASSDDAEEGINGNTPGKIDLESSDLEFGEIEGSTRGVEHIGLRFNGIAIPNGATIISANVNFVVDEDVDNPQPVVMNIHGEAVDNSATFTASPFDISSRPQTTASVDWNIPVWTTVGTHQNSADLKDIIQEIVNRAGWEYDNSLSIIFSPSTATLANPRESGRVAESIDGTSAPVLTIVWEL